jgi:hypothetical protein
MTAALYPLQYEGLVREALREDLGRAGDLTTDAIVPPDRRARGAIVFRREGRVAGLDVALAAFRALDPAARIETRVGEGEDAAAGQSVAFVEAQARALLSAERVALNFLGRLAGIATATRDVAQSLEGTRAQVVCTRKTTPGLRMLEKYAVRVGGGRNHRFGLDDAVLVKDNHRALAGGVAAAELWNDETGKPTGRLLPQWQGNRKTGFAKGGAIVNVWEAPRAIELSYVPQSRTIKDMCFTHDSTKLLAICNDGQIRAWRTGDGALDQSVAAPDSLECGNLFPDGRTLFAIDRTLGYVLFDMVTGGLTPIPIRRDTTVTFLAFDISGEKFVTTTDERWARIWSTKTGAPLSPPVRHDGPLSWADWSPDGKRIAMAGLSSEVRVWDASTGELTLPPLRIGNKPLITVMWSLDGRFLVARSNENLVRVWDATTGEPVTPLLKHNGYILAAQLAANNRLVTLSQPNILRAWDLKENNLPVDVLSDFAKLASGRNLNASGMMLSLKPQAQADLCRSLRQRAPQLFE